MSINTTTHLNFRGDARAALEYYQSVFGGDVVLAPYSATGMDVDPAVADQLAFGQVVSAAGFRVMAYDVLPHQDYDAGTIPVFVSIRGADSDEIASYWQKLSDGSTVVAPLAASEWSPLYGMLRDRFGVTWVLDVEVAWPGA